MRKPPQVGWKERVRSLIQATGFDLVRIPEDDPRYGGPSYDASRPLPAGAVEQLRADHPRLLELRERYAKVDLPMARQTMWGGEYLKDDLTLQYFRGDNA